MKPLDTEATSSPRTDALIAEVMAQYPGESPRAMNRYFLEVHQRLAPLCRELEVENRALREEMCHPKLRAEKLPKSEISLAETISRASA
jgi:hypothetical protein